MDISAVNLQALIAMGLFGVTLFVAHMVMAIHSGRMPGGKHMITYLRALVGFLMAASITFAYYAFAGKDIISGRW